MSGTNGTDGTVPALPPRAAFEDLAEWREDARQAVAELLGGGQSPTWTARELGIGRTTLYRWLREDADLRAAIRERHAERIGRAQVGGTKLADVALAVLAAEALHAPRSADRQRAARYLVESLRKLGAIDPARLDPDAPDTGEVLAEIAWARRDFAAEVERVIERTRKRSPAASLAGLVRSFGVEVGGDN